jgi:hypothetical protein
VLRIVFDGNAGVEQAGDDLHASRPGIGVDQIDLQIDLSQLTEVSECINVGEIIIAQIKPMKIGQTCQSADISKLVIVRIQGGKLMEEQQGLQVGNARRLQKPLLEIAQLG